MYTLTLSEAQAFVRKSMDELADNESYMMAQDLDKEYIDRIISESIVEAITFVHLSAPAAMLQGRDISSNITTSLDGLAVRIDAGSTGILRFCGCKAVDSPIVVSTAVEADSPEGRMQENRFVRGTWDRPVLVHQRDGKAHADPFGQEYRYHSLREVLTGKIFDFFSIIPVPVRGSASFEVSPLLLQPTLNKLTALVMTALGAEQTAAIFDNRTKEYLQ